MLAVLPPAYSEKVTALQFDHCLSVSKLKQRRDYQLKSMAFYLYDEIYRNCLWMARQKRLAQEVMILFEQYFPSRKFWIRKNWTLAGTNTTCRIDQTVVNQSMYVAASRQCHKEAGLEGLRESIKQHVRTCSMTANSRNGGMLHYNHNFLLVEPLARGSDFSL